MLRGDFATAWRVCDAILAERVRTQVECWNWARHEQFLWRGESLANRRVLVHCYHGLGDTLQFARLLTPLSKIAAEVAVWVQPPLEKIVATIDGVHATHALHDAAPSLDRDLDVELMELPHVLRMDARTLPNAVPYIDVGARGARKADGLLHVGLVWRSGDWDERRSLALGEVNALLHRMPSLKWYSFQFGWSHSLPSTLEDMSCENVATMGQRLRDMDLLISVDTMAAHLAGALGLPVWTLLPYECDWRWMRERSDSPWYPTMRLFRQARTGDWASVIDRICDALQAVTAPRRFHRNT
jgi:hypothetical protein